MPLLAFVVPLTVAAPMIAMISMTNAILILMKEWRHLRFRETALLVISALIGVPIGIYIILIVDESVVKCLLAVVVLGFSTWSLWRPNAFSLQSDRSAPAFGLVAGVLGGAYNTAGPPLVMFGTLRRWPPLQFRANLQSYFLLGGTSVLGGHWYSGTINETVVTLFAMCLPLIVIAAIVGRRLTDKIEPEKFTRYVHVGLLGIGVMLLTTALADIVSGAVGPE